MTVSTINTFVSHITSTAQVLYAFNMKIVANEDLYVYLVPAGGSAPVSLLVQDYHYIPYGAGGDGGGTIEMTSAGLSTIGNGNQIYIVRQGPFLQSVNYIPHDIFPAETHEGALDVATLERQELKWDLSRCIINDIWDPNPIYIGDIKDLIAQVANNTESIVHLKAMVDDHEIRILSLEGTAVDHEGRIVSLESRTDLIEDRLDNLGTIGISAIDSDARLAAAAAQATANEAKTLATTRATTTNYGIVQLAENTDTASATNVVTPAWIAANPPTISATVPSATTTVEGIAMLATNGDLASSNKIVTPSWVATNVPEATTSVSGKIKIASQGDTTSTNLAATPAMVSSIVSDAVAGVGGGAAAATQTEVNAGTVTDAYVSPATLRGRSPAFLDHSHIASANDLTGTTSLVTPDWIKQNGGLGGAGAASQTEVDAGLVDTVYVSPKTLAGRSPKFLDKNSFAATTDHTGTDTVVSPSWIAAQDFSGAVKIPSATTTVEGIAKLATNSDTTSTNTIVTPAWVAAQDFGTGTISVPDATTTTKGIVLLADGTDAASTTTVITPAIATSMINKAVAGVGGAPAATQAEVDAGTVGTSFVSPATLAGITPKFVTVNNSATTSAKGIAMLAANSDTTSADKIVTPAWIAANPSAVSVPNASQTVAGITKLSSLTDNTSTNLAATPANVAEQILLATGGVLGNGRVNLTESTTWVAPFSTLYVIAVIGGGGLGGRRQTATDTYYPGGGGAGGLLFFFDYILKDTACPVVVGKAGQLPTPGNIYGEVAGHSSITINGLEYAAGGGGAGGGATGSSSGSGGGAGTPGSQPASPPSNTTGGNGGGYFAYGTGVSGAFSSAGTNGAALAAGGAGKGGIVAGWPTSAGYGNGGNGSVVVGGYQTDTASLGVQGVVIIMY